MRVKIVDELYAYSLEKSVNKALEELEKGHNAILEIKYSIYTYENGCNNPVTYHSAMIIYRAIPYYKFHETNEMKWNDKIYNELVKGGNYD